MTLARCIPKGLDAGLKRALNEAADKWEKSVGDRGKAEVAALNSKLAEIEERRRVAILSANAQARIAAKLSGTTGTRAADTLESFVETSAKGVGSQHRSASVEQHVASGIAEGHMKEFRDLGATTARADAGEVSAGVMRELAGVDTGNAQWKSAAVSLRKGLDYLRRSFNDLGGAIKTRGNYLLPQTWDAARIKEAGGKDAFVEKLAAYYEKPGIMDPLLGPHGAPLTGDELRGALAQIHDTIATGDTSGTIGQIAGAMRGRHLDPRSISFRDVNARIEAAGLFGNPNVFEVVDAHLRQMTTEIGAMKVFGPHPDLAYATAREAAQNAGATPTRLLSVDNTYKAMAGSINAPASANIALGGQVIRSAMSGGLLPLSLVSQLNDVVPVSLASSVFGIPAVRAITSGLKQVVGAGLSREELSRIGIVVDGILAHLHNTGVLDTAGRTRRFTEATMRFYGIKRWAEGMQAGQEAAMLSHLAGLRDATLAEADTAMNGMLGKLGWTERAWDAVRQHGIMDVGGAKFASVRALEESGLTAAEKAEAQAQLVYTSRRFATLGMTVPDAKVRGMMTLGTQAGTLPGEATRLAMQFKTFGTQFFVNQVGQIMQLPTNSARIGYATKLLAGTAALGMVSLQIKRLLKGQGLADMSDHGVQVSAIVQGGGFGVVGDFFNSATQQSRFGHGLVTTLAGPAFGAAEDVAALTLGNIGQAARGEQANFGSEALKLVGKYAPFANAPFMGIAFQRLAVDQARLWADPSGTRRSFMSMEQRQREDYGSQYYWRPGSTLPEFAR